MKFRMGNREKKVFGGIITILLIAGLHLLVFSRKAKEFTRILEDFNKSKSDYETVVKQAKNPSEVVKLEKENEQFKTEFKKLVKQLNIHLPGYYLDGNEDSIRQRREELIINIEKLITMAQDLKNTKLSFLEEKGWNIPLELPEDIQKRPERLWDVISQINGINQILEVIDNPTVKQQKIVQYGELLKEIGMDEPKIDSLKKFGRYLPLINRLCHYRLIIKEKPKDIKMTDQEIKNLLRIEYPDDNLFKLNRQLYSLNDLIKLADENKIEEITEVTLNDFVEIKGPPKKPEEGAEPTPAPQEAPPMGMFDEFAMMGGGPEGMAFGGRGGYARKQKKADKPPENFLGHGTPILLHFTGSNLNTTNFLYAMSHIPRTYELDSLIISTIKDREGVEDVYAWINVIALVDGVIVDLDSIWKEEEKKSDTKPTPGG